MDRPYGVAAVARADPGRIALVQGQDRRTYAELDARANNAARALARAGVGPGDALAVALRNRIAFFEATTAAARLGADVVPVSWRFKQDEMRYMIEDSCAKVTLCEEDAPVDGPQVWRPGAWEAAATEGDGAGLPGAPDPAPVVFRYYTSGTTGRPKAVERPRPASPQRWIEGILTYARAYGILDADDDGVHLVVGPLSHTAPCAMAHWALALGHAVVVMERFDAGECLSLIERERVTWTHMVPINFVRILALPEDVRERSDLSSVRRILHAAAPCPVEVKRRIMDVFPPGAVREYYGMTEGLATIVSAEEWLRKPGTVGRAAPGLEVRILDEEGCALQPGEVGLVYVSPVGGVKFSYAGAPEKTAQAWRGDLFTVGDMGYLDADGYLFLVDRKIDLIISGGANVYPAEVEAALYSHPAVADVAVIGVPDEEWGERVHAIVEPRAPVTSDEIIAFCRDRLAHFKCPRSVELIDAMPRDDNGKVRKRELRERHWAGRERKI